MREHAGREKANVGGGRKSGWGVKAWGERERWKGGEAGERGRRKGAETHAPGGVPCLPAFCSS